MKRIYVLKDKKNDKVYTSFMVKPLADLVKKDRRTLKNWIDRPLIAERNGYEIIEAIHIVGLKGKDDEDLS